MSNRDWIKKRRVICKHCESSNLVKYGIYKTKQKYQCQECGKVFIDNSALPFMQTSTEEIMAAWKAYYSGMNLEEVREYLWDRYKYKPSKSTVYRWLIRYTNIVVGKIDKYIPIVGNAWVVIESKVRGYQIIDIIDTKTRYLLSTTIVIENNKNEVTKLINNLSNKIALPPSIIFTGGEIQRTNNMEIDIINTEGDKIKKVITVNKNQELVDKIYYSFKDRNKLLKWLAKEYTAVIIMNGWRAIYNYFIIQESIGWITPAEKAGIQTPYASWH